jgi:hypothetical protein
MKTQHEKFKYFVSLASFYFLIVYLATWAFFVWVVPIMFVTVSCYLYVGWNIARSIYHFHLSLWEDEGHKSYKDIYEQSKDIV